MKSFMKIRSHEPFDYGAISSVGRLHMRGFSYVELLAGFAVSTMLILGFVRFGHQTTSQFLSGRRQQQAHGPLLTAQTSLRRILAEGEAEFWQHFPSTQTVIHDVDIIKDAVLATKTCPHASKGGCLIFRDVTPLSKAPIAYQIADQESPTWIHPTPWDPSLPIGPGEEFKPGLIALLLSEGQSTPVLVSDVAGDQVYLLAGDVALWHQVHVFHEDEKVTLMPLGYLSFTHLNLHPSDQRHFALRYQPWWLTEGTWQPKRSRTGETQLLDLLIQPATETRPHRLFLVSQSLMPQVLPQPKVVANQSFAQEVHYVSLAF